MNEQNPLTHEGNRPNKAVALIAAGVATLALAGCDINHNKLDDANKEATKTMESVKAKDLLSCEITDVQKGPNVTYTAARPVGKVPSVLVTYNLNPTKLAQTNPWLRDGGSNVDGNRVEVQWFEDLKVKHDIQSRGTAPGRTMGTSEEGDNSQVLIPLNDTPGYRGIRNTTLSVSVENVQVSTDRQEDDQRNLDPLDCGTMELDVQKGNVQILHAATPAHTVIK